MDADVNGDAAVVCDVDDGVATITLNRPQRRNAINGELVDRWAELLLSCQAADAVHVIVVTGAGKAFCAGGDFGEIGDDWTPAQAKSFVMDHVLRVADALEQVDKPVIAMVNGAAMGAGLDMAMLCDLRFASTEATLAEAYIDVAVAPGDGGAWLLPRLVGRSTALDLLWTGRRLTGEEAERIGLVDRAVPPDQLRAVTYEYAQKLARGPQAAIRIIKRAVVQAPSMDFRTHIDLMSSHMAVLRSTDDYREGVAALREKRPPRFGGTR